MELLNSFSHRGGSRRQCELDYATHALRELRYLLTVGEGSRKAPLSFKYTSKL